ncbi:ABC transporter substrate-binding protein [Pseudoroseomonas rhizosphaerae]|uniref:ABC transporter substrate-binding protein n=2 Tax=Teichococcus rhizosphaerae TaxID=1335062 RepID=A0A2C7A8S7_9PROT|nr:ABC transporter substrate-binding protein [Pseudoroseomonas rhizosphaerae]
MHLPRRCMLALSLPGLAMASTVRAQAWPERPITLVIPFAPGAFTDAVGRFVASALTPRLGQSVLVENRPGAGGSIAARSVARVAPDGYTLLVGTQGTNASNASLLRNAGYDPINDFTPVHGLAKIVGTLVCNPARPWRTVAELVADAKQRPGRITYGSSGSGTVQHLLGEMFRLSAGVDIVHVPYRGSAPALTDLLAGAIDLMFEYPNPGIENIRAGRIRPLAVAAPERLDGLPEVPTMAEAGIRGVEAETWFALFGPRGLKAEALDRLARETKAIVASEEFAAFIHRQGASALMLKDQALRDFLASEVAKWRGFAEASGFRLD